MSNLSILIPARNEMFLGKTIENLLENIEGDTEIIAVLDGYDTEIPKIPEDPRVTVIKHHKSVGQRAATNEAARLSQSKYLAKVDAHCAFDKGFDVKLLADMQDDWTMVPTMKNLHAFDWVCKCGVREYQGTTHPCPTCGGQMEREMVWQPRRGVTSNFYRFDNTLHFQYWKDFEKRPQGQGDLCETMSLQGSFFLLTREKYFQLNICDEAHGSWGQQGTEVACKTWLSGGRVIVNKKTWYAHMFRTQGGDFGFPYPNPGIQRARDYSRRLWLENEWPLAKYPLSWLVERFSPVPDWNVSKGILYYTDNELDEKIMKDCQTQLRKAAGQKKIISVSLKPLEFGDNIVLPLERSPLTMFKQILAGLEALDTDIVFFAEHDVLYDQSHFDFTPTSKEIYYYNQNVWQIRTSDGFAVKYDCKRLSQLCADRQLLIKHYKERIRRCEQEGFSRKIGFEPGSHNRAERVDDYQSDIWNSQNPNFDLKHGRNLTAARWKQSQFRSQRSCRNWQESNLTELQTQAS